ncbi:hypothetical protein LWH94_17150 [Marinobacter sp. G11]|jgi:hypothetical protein|nr:hypothetical protein [Marinobacter sp. G11]MCE0760911.1 hypothetical protein [Marinobacter sp. G11]
MANSWRISALAERHRALGSKQMMLDHYQQTKNLLVSYDINPLGFF